jgi:hypothetical protein
LLDSELQILYALPLHHIKAMHSIFHFLLKGMTIMSHVLHLELPEDIYKPLVKNAKRKGRSPEEIAIEYLKSILLRLEDDPIEKFIGAFHSDISDWAEKHDNYLGQTLMEEMKKQEPGK